ncbi:MAG: prepilin-type N-terminal cleavage/methylation domain-containing protein [Candidatus Hydrogenedentes bacterium]|nr:prepilin-type N-terminal cleavage/methylation domain-containing protein [Candidatus Hydrogenedentota bacterium]
MHEREHKERGYTLTELLIVIAIFALLTGVAIPTIARVGGFLSDDPDLAARELYSSLRGIKVHAATYNVDTAIVYGLEAVEDSVSGAPVRVISSYGIARRMNDAELKALEDQATDESTPQLLPADNIAAPAFVMVREREAIWRRMPAKACVLSVLNNDNPSPGVEGLIGATTTQSQQEGFTAITLYDSAEGVTGTYYTKIQPNPDALLTFNSTTEQEVIDFAFPAHIFKPSGIVEPQDSPVARFTLNVGPVPSASLEDRFAVAPGDINPATGNPDAAGVWKVPVRIELFRTTGRVKMTS